MIARYLTGSISSTNNAIINTTDATALDHAEHNADHPADLIIPLSMSLFIPGIAVLFSASDHRFCRILICHRQVSALPFSASAVSCALLSCRSTSCRLLRTSGALSAPPCLAPLCFALLLLFGLPPFPVFLVRSPLPAGLVFLVHSFVFLPLFLPSKLFLSVLRTSYSHSVIISFFVFFRNNSETFPSQYPVCPNFETLAHRFHTPISSSFRSAASTTLSIS